MSFYLCTVITVHVVIRCTCSFIALSGIEINIDFAVGHRTCTATGRWLHSLTNYTLCVLNYPLSHQEVDPDVSDSVQVYIGNTLIQSTRFVGLFCLLLPCA